MRITEKRHHDPERAASRRKQVLEAAALCFSRSGFHGASMAEISKAAGMSAGHIYNYFDGKDAIIMAFVARRMEEVSLLLRDLGQRDDPLQAMLDDAPNTLAEQLDPAFWTLPMEIHAEAARNSRIAAALQEADRDSRLQFRALLKAAREKRGLSVDDTTLDGRTDILIALFHGLPLRALHRPDADRDALLVGFRVALQALLMT
ncbi:MAG: TetR/AcrR family transcriptional regulator [Sphingomonadaceae bacterium]